MMYLILGGLVGLFGFFIASYISDMRDMKRLLRHQQDELHQLRMELGDVVAMGRKRDYEKAKMLGRMKKSRDEGMVMPMGEDFEEYLQDTRPGETDQKLLLR